MAEQKTSAAGIRPFAAAGKPCQQLRQRPAYAQASGASTVRRDVQWTAVLVENMRSTASPGNAVAMLSSISESGIDVVHQRRYFWDNVYERLDHLGNRVSRDDRRRIEEAVALKVPRLSRKEHAASVKTEAAYGFSKPKPWRASA